MSPAAVCGYHTRLFSLVAPKLSCLTGSSVPADFESIRCEAYGPGGVALIVECRTDDPARTLGRVREALQRHGGALGARGSVSYLFNRVGLLVFAPVADRRRLVEAAVKAGAEDVVPNPDGSVDVLTDPADFDSVRGSLAGHGLVPSWSELTLYASATVSLDLEEALWLVYLLGALEEINDVENVYTNAEIPDEVLAGF